MTTFKELKDMSSLQLLYRIRKALGFDEKHSLTYLDSDVRIQRKALLAWAPLIRRLIDTQQAQGDSSDLNKAYWITIRATLNEIKEADQAFYNHLMCRRKGE